MELKIVSKSCIEDGEKSITSEIKWDKKFKNGEFNIIEITNMLGLIKIAEQDIIKNLNYIHNHKEQVEIVEKGNAL